MTRTEQVRREGRAKIRQQQLPVESTVQRVMRHRGRFGRLGAHTRVEYRRGAHTELRIYSRGLGEGARILAEHRDGVRM